MESVGARNVERENERGRVKERGRERRERAECPGDLAKRGKGRGRIKRYTRPHSIVVGRVEERAQGTRGELSSRAGLLCPLRVSLV